MVYKYVSKNRYFKDIIDDYFKTDWTKYNDINLDNLNYVDVDYPNKSCNKCKNSPRLTPIIPSTTSCVCPLPVPLPEPEAILPIT